MGGVPKEYSRRDSLGDRVPHKSPDMGETIVTITLQTQNPQLTSLIADITLIEWERCYALADGHAPQSSLWTQSEHDSRLPQLLCMLMPSEKHSPRLSMSAPSTLIESAVEKKFKPRTSERRAASIRACRHGSSGSESKSRSPRAGTGPGKSPQAVGPNETRTLGT